MKETRTKEINLFLSPKVFGCFKGSGRKFLFLFTKNPLFKVPYIIFVKSLIVDIFCVPIHFYFIWVFTQFKFEFFLPLVIKNYLLIYYFQLGITLFNMRFTYIVINGALIWYLHQASYSFIVFFICICILENYSLHHQF